MAINVVIPILIPLEEDLRNATRLLSGTGRSLLEFTHHRYCAVLREDAPTSSDVITVVANHKEGASVKYSITGGNRDGLFTIDQKTGLITLAAALDYELYDKHELVVSGEGGGQVVHTIVQVVVADVNDNPPVFVNPDPHVTIIEEDDRHLPATLIKVDARDPDQSDEYGLLYTLRGDGVDGYSPEDAFFKINPRTGDLRQLRALDRDPPNGKRIWKLRVKVQDGQEQWKGGKRVKTTKNIQGSRDQSQSWDYDSDYQNDQPMEQILQRDEFPIHDNQNYEVPKQYKNGDFGWDSSKVQESETSRRLWKTKTNGYERLVSLQSGGGSARKHAWTRDRNRKYKGRPLSQTNSNNWQHPHTQHSWKFKEISHKDPKKLSWNDQARFGISKSKHSHRKEEISHKNSWDLSKRIRAEKRNFKDKWVSISEPRISSVSSVEHDDEVDQSFSSRRYSIGDHTWQVNRRTTEEEQKTEYPNNNQAKKLQEQEIQDRISYPKLRSGKTLGLYQDDMRGEGRAFEKSTDTKLSGSLELDHSQKTEAMDRKAYIKKICQDGNDSLFGTNDFNTFLRRCESIIESEGSERNYFSGAHSELQLRKSSQSSWSSYLGTRIKFKDETESQEHVLPHKSSHGIQEENFRSLKSEWKEIESSDVHRIRKDLGFKRKAKRSPGVTSKSKHKASNENGLLLNSYSENISSMENLKETDEPSSNSVNNLKINQSFDSDINVSKSGNSVKSAEVSSSTSATVSSHSRKTSIATKAEDLGKEDISITETSNVSANQDIMNYDSQSNKTTKTEGLSKGGTELSNSHDQKTRDFAFTKTRNTLLQRIDEPSGYSVNKYSSSIDNQLVGDSRSLNPDGDRNNSISKAKSLLPSPATRSRQIRSSSENAKSAPRKRESKWVLTSPRGKGWLSRGARDVVMEYPFDNFNLEDEECYDASKTGGPAHNEERIHEDTPVHEVEMMVTVIVKDINDNAPIFPNVTMFGEVQENGPVDLSVAEVWAWDADDTTEGTNARITYAIEKNVIHDKSGEAIFNVNPQSGLVTTALCCLDRETTPEYHIQVVAADGGGLKGTGTVVVRLTDENDNSPRLARQYWELEVDETWGDGPPNNITLLEMTAADPDTKNNFSYKIVEESGWGWDHFGIRSTGASGQLYALRKLDYEDDTHRQGFKFMVQVTDRGDDGWTDPRHQDTAWVGVRLRDLNDNPPQFGRPHAHVTISEDSPPGTLLTTVSASDPDVGGVGQVDYKVVGGWNSLQVDAEGGVTLYRQLDREAEDGALGIAKILGIDRGEPPLTSTATLTITVTDVNDCSPRLLPSDVLHVTEGDPPVMLGVLTATDDDIWALGHGPPFTLSLSPTNPPYVMDLISLKFDQHVDSGRGGAELWTRGSLDRETHRTLPVEVVIGDAGGLNRTQTVTVVVNDLNDNPMKPASKTVYLWKTQGSGSDAPLGRVYVDDPDDWDIADKTFRWAAKPHPLFKLDANDGTIFASSLVNEGRYQLHFMVSDRVWSQVGVEANVTVVVRTLSHDALTHAAPVILSPTTPADLTRGWTPTSGGGGLGKLLETVHDIISEGPSYKVEVVSIYGNYALPGITSTVSFTSTQMESLTSHSPGEDHPSGSASSFSSSGEHPAPTACIWVNVKDDNDEFVDPVRLQGLLALHTEKLEKATGLSVSLKDPPHVFDKKGSIAQQVPKKDKINKEYPSQFEGPQDSALSTLKLSSNDGASVTTLASKALPLQVVDTNITSLVTPLLIRTHECLSEESPWDHSFTPYDSDTCTPSTCLNGGRCVRFPSGSRCVCPGGSWGPQCKILSRTFSGSSWGWVRPLPPCLPTTLSLRVLTRNPHGLLLYSGPLVPHSQFFGSSAYSSLPSPMFALQIVESKPQLLVEGIGTSLVLDVNVSITDGEWHTIHLHLHSQGVVMMIDLCGLGWQETSTDDSHCVTRKSWGLPEGLGAWEVLGPLQLGGVAQGPQRPQDYGWSRAPTPYSLNGCLSHLTINDQLVDLGEPACSKDSLAGCQPQEAACSGDPGACGIKGTCSGGHNKPACHCDPGWTGVTCDTPTVPATLDSKSYMKLALSFTPSSRVVNVQLRVRTLGDQTGMLVRLAAQHTQHSFTVHLRAGVACASVSGAGWAARVACVEGRPVGDGQWHTIKAERHGHNLIISVDGEGDEWRLNNSLPTLLPEGRHSLLLEEIKGPPMPLEIDRHDGVTVGGLPEFLGVKLVTVAEDLQGTCIDDLRVSGHQLPLPPAVNSTTWGQVTTLDGFLQGCNPPNSCLNTTCDPPLSCHPTWTQPSCSCGSGSHLQGSRCEDVDECLFEPCLHGGTCYNTKPDYLCLCGPNRIGENCEWAKVSSSGHPLTAPAAIAAVTLSFFFLVVLGVCISIRHHRLRSSRSLARQHEEEGGDKESITTVKTGCKRSMMSLDPEKKETFLGLRSGWREQEITTATTTKTKGPEDESHTTFLQLLKLSRAKPAKEPKGGNTGTSSGVSVAVITSSGGSRITKEIGGTLQAEHPHQHHHLPGEDLRNYAYEGDGSSSGSLTSTISGLRAELEHEEAGKVVAAEFVEVMDLLKNLPEAPKSSILLARLKEKRNLVKEVRDPEVISTVSMGSLRRRLEGENTGKSSSSSCPLASSAPSAAYVVPPKDIRIAEMPSSKGVLHVVCSKDELTTSC